MKIVQYSLAAVAVLTGCTAISPPIASPPAAPPPAASMLPAPAAPIAAYRAGTGTVQSIVSEHSASAGGSGGPGGAPPYLLTMRMDDGSEQTLRENMLRFRVGDRVRVTADGRIERP